MTYADERGEWEDRRTTESDDLVDALFAKITEDECTCAQCLADLLMIAAPAAEIVINNTATLLRIIDSDDWRETVEEIRTEAE